MKTLTPRRITLERERLLHALTDGEDVHLHLRSAGQGWDYPQWTVGYQQHYRLCFSERCILIGELLSLVEEARSRREKLRAACA